MRTSPHRITIVQYAGDFREAAMRLAAGGAENYRAQRYTVDHVEALAQRHASVATVTGFTESPYEVTLPSGAKAVGAGFTSTWSAGAMAQLVRRTAPTRIVLRTPSLGLLRRIVAMRVPTLALIADSFPDRSWKERMKRRLTVHYLNAAPIQRVGNHGRTSAAQLITAGVRADKVFAWDYPSQDTPDARSPKSEPGGRHLVYVGMVSAAKGVDDLLDAVALASGSVPGLTLDIIGEGDVERLRAVALKLGLHGVKFLGRVANDTVVQRMAEADAVVVPSRHDYSEGLPLTIYEAFCSRTPLVISDHPMFVPNVVHGRDGLMFRGGDAADLAAQLQRLFGDRALYATLSANSAAAWRHLQLAQTWAGAIDDWLDGDAARLA
ncbi:MAG: glycosyltransferase [Comamonadaceae bacterium]|nr:MAG: glycosyltransferase [Comamonadaceae bacterium]